MIWIASSVPEGGTRQEVIGVVPELWESVRHHQAEMVRYHQAEVAHGPGDGGAPQHLGSRTGSQPRLRALPTS